MQSVDSRKYRGYTLVADTDCKVMIITKQSYNMVLSVYNMDRERNCQTLLQKVPIIRQWPLMKIIAFSEHFQKQSFEPGQIVYDLGDPTDTVYFVK